MKDSKVMITHPGVIQEVNGQNARVRILARSACASCHAKGMCSVADMKEKIIDVNVPRGKTYVPGDRVMLYMEQSMGNKAAFYAYFLPFLLILAVLLITFELTHNEALSGLLSIGILIPYYYVLYLLKDKMKRSFRFKMR
ncbi:MAG: SoxR reducing system RseC family protein [Bacteroidales bacterium]